MIPLYPKSWQRAAVVVTIGAIVTVGLCAWPYTVDDAFIVARYARRLAQGFGYTFNPGPATDGVTGPLWLLPGWLASVAGLDPVVTAKIVGLGCAALACGCVVQRLAHRALGTAFAGLAALLFAAQPTAGAWGVAGLETGAAMLVLCWATLCATRRPRPAAWQLGAAVGLLGWLRPELGLAGAVLWLAAAQRLGVRRAAPGFALSAASAIALLAFRWIAFGSWMPLAYHAKQASLAQGFDYAARGTVIVWGAFGGVLAVFGALRGRRDDRWVAGVLVAHVLAIVLAGGDWMPGFRLFAPVLPLGIWLAAVGAIAIARGGVKGAASGGDRAAIAHCSAAAGVPDGRASLVPGGSAPRTALALGLVLLTIGVLATDLVIRVPEWRAAGDSRERVGRALVTRLRASATRVALVDIGYLGYATDLEMIDLAGITDPAVGLLPGGHLDKGIDPAWLAGRAPDALLLHAGRPPLLAADASLLSLAGSPVERRVAGSAWARRNFRVALTLQYAPAYHYVLLLPVHTSD